MTRVMFILDTQPLAGARVSIGPHEDVQTDKSGKIDVELPQGVHTLRVEREEGVWAERLLDTSTSSAGLLVINVSASTDPGPLPGHPGHFISAYLEQLHGRYVFECVLGRGGMGVVIKARDKLLNRSVAIKVLNEALRFNAEAQKIFMTEARNLATLKHPNLVVVHDVNIVGDAALMITEFVAGSNLEEHMRRGGHMEEGALIKVALQLSQALAYIHQSGMIHRDVKPGNLIIREDGSLKVLDFGLARTLDHLLIRGTLQRGTPGYMAPEQIEGRELTARTDIYQLGITLYELLSGYLPFESADMAYAHVHLQPRPLEELVPEASPRLTRLIMACLAKDPAQRPADALEIAGVLAALRHPAGGDATAELCGVGMGAPEPGLLQLEPAVPQVTVKPDVDARRASMAQTMSQQAPQDATTSQAAVGKHRERRLWVIMGLLAIVGSVGVGSALAGWRPGEVAAPAPDALQIVLAPEERAGALAAPLLAPVVHMVASPQLPVEPTLERPPAQEPAPPSMRPRTKAAKRAPGEPEVRPLPEGNAAVEVSATPLADVGASEILEEPAPPTTPLALPEPAATEEAAGDAEARPVESEPEEKKEDDPDDKKVTREVIRRKTPEKPRRAVPRSF